MVPGHGIASRTTLLNRVLGFRTVRRMEPTSADDLDERLESLPWEHLRPAESRDPRRLAVVAAAVVVAAVVASATRTLWPAPPLSAPIPPPSTVEQASTPTQTGPPGTDRIPVATSVSAVTEADLRAVSAEDAARAVTAHAEWFVSEWLTIDGHSDTASVLLPDGVDLPVVDESARSFVESAVALSAQEVRLGSWEVAVLVRSLSAFGDGDHLRIPARVFLVTVGIGDDGPFVVDLPSPGPLPVGRAAALDLVEESAPVPVIDAALVAMRQVGLPDEATIDTFRRGDLWRVTSVVRDRAGVPFVVAVWLDEAGERVPAPG